MAGIAIPVSQIIFTNNKALALVIVKNTPIQIEMPNVQPDKILEFLKNKKLIKKMISGESTIIQLKESMTSV